MGMTYHIALVEDHPLMRQALRQLLEGESDLVVVSESASAEAAQKLLERLEPDLLLVDLSLPGASGLELVERLKLMRPALRCLVVTGHVSAYYRLAALKAGAVGFVTKDDPDEVLRAVRHALR